MTTDAHEEKHGKKHRHHNGKSHRGEDLFAFDDAHGHATQTEKSDTSKTSREADKSHAADKAREADPSVEGNPSTTQEGGARVTPLRVVGVVTLLAGAAGAAFMVNRHLAAQKTFSARAMRLLGSTTGKAIGSAVAASAVAGAAMGARKIIGRH